MQIHIDLGPTYKLKYLLIIEVNDIKLEVKRHILNIIVSIFFFNTYQLIKIKII